MCSCKSNLWILSHIIIMSFPECCKDYFVFTHEDSPCHAVMVNVWKDFYVINNIHFYIQSLWAPMKINTAKKRLLSCLKLKLWRNHVLGLIREMLWLHFWIGFNLCRGGLSIIKTICLSWIEKKLQMQNKCAAKF